MSATHHERAHQERDAGDEEEEDVEHRPQRFGLLEKLDYKQKMALVGWAADRVLAPHAEHDDPREHPSCLLCRAQRFMGEGSDAVDVPASQPSNDAAESVTRAPGVIQWLSIDDHAHGREWSDDPTRATGASGVALGD